jgi:hypothetical protein
MLFYKVFLCYPVLVASPATSATTWPCIAIIMLPIIIVSIIRESVASAVVVVVVVITVPIIIVVPFPIETHFSSRWKNIKYSKLGSGKDGISEAINFPFKIEV